MVNEMRVLVVEDYPPLARSLVQGLRETRYAVDLATDGEEAIGLLEAATYDAVILDLMLPRLGGREVLERIRRAGNPTAVLVLTARDGLDDRVSVLDLGADDYLVKPFAFEELLARLRAIIRRRYQSTDSTIRVADLEIDTQGRVVRRGGTTIPLSAREYAVLEYLAVRQGQVVSRAEIWDHVYDFASEPSSNVVDVYIGYLRRKLENDRGNKLIHTRRGQGYVLGVEE
jgi:two-component system copper resistance phosphate regulon response regulator CusR